MKSFIAPDDHWVIWTFLVGMAALSLLLEHKFTFVKKITGAVVALCGGILVSNLGILPSKSPSYDIVDNYVVPLAIPLLLMKLDLRKVFRETGRLMGAFHLSALGTVIGSIIAVALLYPKIPHLEKIGPAMTGSYIGGSLNFMALINMFEPPKYLSNATLVADSGVMAIYFIILISLPGLAVVRRFFPVTPLTKERTGEDSEQSGADYWKPKLIGLLDIATCLALAFIIATVSVKVSGCFNKKDTPILLKGLLGQKYLVLTTLSVLVPTLLPGLAGRISGNEELGMFFIFIFFVSIGLPASIKQVIINAPYMLLFCAIILLFNFLTTIALGKLLGYEIEELVLAGIVTSGGPANGVAIAISKNWKALIVPSLLTGIWGYVIGTYIGYFMGLILRAMF